MRAGRLSSLDRDMLVDLVRADVDHFADEAPAAGALSSEEYSAFADMLKRGYALSDKQRGWARRVAERIGLSAPHDNSNVPRGREVEPAPVLRELPKKPPAGRSA